MNSSKTLTRLRPGALGVAACLLVVSGCSSGSDDATTEPSTSPSSSETPDAPEESDTPVATADPSPVDTDPDDEADLPGGLLQVGDKSVYLDGFFGVRVPQGWSVTSAEVPLLSSTPPGGEKELDSEALTQSLVLNPDTSPRGATFALVHYEHSDSVPDLDRFTPAIVDLLSGDGSQIGDASEVTIGKQPGRLHTVTSASGANGVLITLRAGDEYFFILSLASESAFVSDAADLLGSVSMVPEALHS